MEVVCIISLCNVKKEQGGNVKNRHKENVNNKHKENVNNKHKEKENLQEDLAALIQNLKRKL